MLNQGGIRGFVGDTDLTTGDNGFEMTSPTCTDISPAIRPPSFPIMTQGYYTPSTMNNYSPNHGDTENLLEPSADKQDTKSVEQPEAQPHVPSAQGLSQRAAVPGVPLSGSVLSGAIEITELSSTSQDASALDVSFKRGDIPGGAPGQGQGTKNVNRFNYLTSKHAVVPVSKTVAIQGNQSIQQSSQLSQSLSASMTGEFSKLEVTEDEEQRLQRQGVSIDSIQQTLNLTYPDATDAQKIRKLLQILANTTITNTQLQAEKDELARSLEAATKTKATEVTTSEYLTERAQLFEKRAHAAEEKLVRAEQEILEYKRNLRKKDQEIDELVQKCNDLTSSLGEVQNRLQEAERDLEIEQKRASSMQDEHNALLVDSKYLKKYVSGLEDDLATTKSALIETQVELRRTLTRTSVDESKVLQGKISNLEMQVKTLSEKSDQQYMTLSSDLGPAVSLRESNQFEAIHIHYQQQFLEKQMEIVELKAQLQQLSAELNEEAGLRFTANEKHAMERQELENRNRNLTLMVDTLTRRAADTPSLCAKNIASVQPKIQMETVDETIYSESDMAAIIAGSNKATPSQINGSTSCTDTSSARNKEIELLEQENSRLQQENGKLSADKAKLKNALKQIKLLQREYENSQGQAGVNQDTFSHDDDSRRSSLGSNTEDAIMVPGTMIPRPTELLKNQVKLLKTDLGKAKEETVELQQRLKDCTEARMRAEVENKVLVERLENTERRLKELQMELARMQLENTSLNTILSEQQSTRKESNTNVEFTHRQTNTDALSAVPVAPTEFKIPEEFKKRVEDLESQRASLIQQLETERKANEGIKAHFEGEKVSLEAENVDLKSMITELKDKLDAAEKHSTLCNSLVTAMHSANSANAEKLRAMENMEQVELARKDKTITILRNEIEMHQEEISTLKKELFIRDEETRRLLAKNLAIEARFMGLLSNQTCFDGGINLSATNMDSTGLGQPIVDAALRSSSRHIRNRLNTMLESGLNNPRGEGT